MGSDSEKLLPCPFCGSNEVRAGSNAHYCVMCGAAAPTTAWNRRHTMPSQVEGCECGGDMTKICGSRWCLATPPAPSEGERVANELMSFVDGDHLRGCEGRNYSCSCGYDETKDKLATKAATLLRTAVPGVSEWFDWPGGSVEHGELYLAQMVEGGKPVLVAVEAAGEEVSFYHHEKDQYLTIDPLRLKRTGEKF